jgi:dolichyl-phosphate-mannose--protein O-mannosyl transferase
MKKIKQILAILGILFLVSLYVITLICAIVDSSKTMDMFMASLYATVVIPVLIWAYTFVYKLVTKDKQE